jgi:hypothetical protein
MTQAAQDLLLAFESLPLSEQREVALAIMRRAMTGENLLESAFDELAGELFSGYEAEENANIVF